MRAEGHGTPRSEALHWVPVATAMPRDLLQDSKPSSAESRSGAIHGESVAHGACTVPAEPRNVRVGPRSRSARRSTRVARHPRPVDAATVRIRQISTLPRSAELAADHWATTTWGGCCESASTIPTSIVRTGRSGWNRRIHQPVQPARACAPPRPSRRAAQRVPPTSCMNRFLHPTPQQRMERGKVSPSAQHR
jgi:hypothetical protein